MRKLGIKPSYCPCRYGSCLYCRRRKAKKMRIMEEYRQEIEKKLDEPLPWLEHEQSGLSSSLRAANDSDQIFKLPSFWREHRT
jgi:hypothetical protein